MIFNKLLKTAIASSVLCAAAANAYTVGLAFPTQDDQRWYSEGKMLNDKLISAGFNTEVFYGGDLDVELQKKQITRLINSGVNLLIIAAIDDTSLVDVLQPAIDNKIPVISYDRLIKNTDAPTYYASVDNEMIGEMQGKYIVDQLRPGNGNVKTIEIFAGSMDDNNAKVFYQGAMRKLGGFIDLGYIVVKSGQQSFEQTSTEGWSGELANKRMNDLIEKVGYSPNGEKLDAILSPNDGIADGIIFCLKKNGYTAENMPKITGCDSTPTAITHINNGEQGMTIYKSTELCNTVVDMVTDISKGNPVDVNDDFSYDNGFKIMDSVLCDPELIDYSNTHTVSM
ncbi:MAG: sugar-binding protein [Succinivibrio sp.]